MKRNVNLDEISDGKLYNRNDLVKVGCHDCKDCHSCCTNVGTSITLDPFDVHNLSFHLKKDFQQLLDQHIQLNVVDGIVLPNLLIRENAEACTFMNAENRCSIHSFRPGICRLFPLGRFYENHSFQYFLQIHECPQKNKTKIKIQKWLDIPEIERYEKFINQWHSFLLLVQQKLETTQDDQTIQKINMLLLNRFFIRPFSEEIDFYQEFLQRLEETKKELLI